MDRDLIGYGRNVPRIDWPQGARIAVSMVVNYEEGAEYSLLDGDSHHETNGEVPSPVPSNERDLNNESFFEYGSRVGVWRLLNLLERYQAPSTFFCCALALERNPEVAKEIVARVSAGLFQTASPMGMAPWRQGRPSGRLGGERQADPSFVA